MRQTISNDVRQPLIMEIFLDITIVENVQKIEIFDGDVSEMDMLMEMRRFFRGIDGGELKEVEIGTDGETNTFEF